MSIKTTQLIRCDHIHDPNGMQCIVERAQSKIDPIEPMYHLNIEIEVIDAGGAHQLVKEDIHLCFWDLYYHMSAYYEQAKIDVDSRKARAAEQATEGKVELMDALL